MDQASRARHLPERGLRLPTLNGERTRVSGNEQNMADDEPMSSTSPRSGRRGIRIWAPRRSVRSAATAFGVLTTLLLAAAIAGDTMSVPGRTGAVATDAPSPVAAVTTPTAPDSGAGGVGDGETVAPRPTPGTPTSPPTSAPTSPPTAAPTGPLTNAPPTDPAVTGVLLILDEEMSDLLTYGEFDTVVQAMTGPVNTAANACGTSLAGMISAGGGLVVRLDDPSLNACLVTELTGVEHIVSAEEDMRMAVRD